MEINPRDLVRGEFIGAGAFGEVYTGLYLGTQVAIKKLTVSEDGRKELFNELQVCYSCKCICLFLFKLYSHLHAKPLFPRVIPEEGPTHMLCRWWERAQK